jgi:hypothetical protein
MTSVAPHELVLQRAAPGFDAKEVMFAAKGPNHQGQQNVRHRVQQAQEREQAPLPTWEQEELPWMVGKPLVVFPKKGLPRNFFGQQQTPPQSPQQKSRVLPQAWPKKTGALH